jgi:SAM-dependent methyltransferase
VDSSHFGACAGDGYHTHHGSGVYLLARHRPGVSGHGGWRLCTKCLALTFVGGSEVGACPAGGTHDHKGSVDFSLCLDPRIGQPGWRCCNKCQMIWYILAGSGGACPGGGGHDYSNSRIYYLALVPNVDWNRKVMNEETLAFVSSLPTETMDALEVSGTAWGILREWNSYETVQYPDFDLCYDIVPHKMFDIIFAEQVLEHVRYPYRAVRNVYRMLRVNGWFILTTPFLIQIHGGKMDYTRWTPEGIKYLLEECGFDAHKISAGAWGNRECAIADFNSCAEGHGWHPYNPAEHSLANEVEYPVVVWAFAQKGDIS